MNAAQLTHSRMSKSPATFLLALTIVCSNGANAASSDLLWQDVVDGGLDVSDTAEAVAVFGGTVYAAGFIETSGISSFAVRAYNAKTGDLLWADQPDGEPGQDIANDVHASANGVVVCGVTDEGKFGVRVHDVRDGHLLWEDRSQSGSAAACDADENIVFVVGSIRSSEDNPDFAVRAYDSATGVLLWEDQLDGGAEVADQAHALSISAGRLYVVGGIQQVAGDDDMVIRSYDAGTGALIWHQVFAGAAGERDEAFAVTVGPHRVFVSGVASLATGALGNTWAVQAYRADTGKLLWADYHEQQEVNDIIVQDKRVIAVGQRQAGPAVVRAYDVVSGDILWRNSFGSSFSAAMAIDTDGQLAYLGGYVRSSSVGAPAFTVRAVDLITGATVWQNRFKSSKAGGRVNDIVVDSNRVYAVGLTQDAVTTEVKDFLVRVYGEL